MSTEPKPSAAAQLSISMALPTVRQVSNCTYIEYLNLSVCCDPQLQVSAPADGEATFTVISLLEQGCTWSPGPQNPSPPPENPTPPTPQAPPQEVPPFVPPPGWGGDPPGGWSPPAPPPAGGGGNGDGGGGGIVCTQLRLSPLWLGRFPLSVAADPCETPPGNDDVPPPGWEDQWDRLTPGEKRLVKSKSYWLLRFWVMKNIREEAWEMARFAVNEPMDPNPDDTFRNAFQHAIWNALLTHEFGYQDAKEWADAHEDVDGPLSPMQERSRRMDLHNNAVGRRWAGTTGNSGGTRRTNAYNDVWAHRAELCWLAGLDASDACGS
jgi:hypothetical protein